jgi:hypothetical protein
LQQLQPPLYDAESSLAPYGLSQFPVCVIHLFDFWLF